MKFAPYSVSKIELYNKCPKAFKYRYIDKIKTPMKFYHLEKGSLWHKLIEYKLQDKLNEFKKPKFKELTNEDYLQQLKDIKSFFTSNIFKEYYTSNYNKQYEQYFTINEDGSVSNKKTKYTLMLGYIDFNMYNEDSVFVIDWKTGKKPHENYPKSDFQLDIYAYYMYIKYNITNIISKYCFVEHNYEQTKDKFNFNKIWKDLNNNINKIERDSLFMTKESPLCDWCEFQTHCFNDAPF
jgi:putative RecB family exonuclease